MERKALAVVIILLSLLVVLALIYFNRPATAPPLSPSIRAAFAPPAVSRSAVPGIHDNANVSRNATATPTPVSRVDNSRASVRPATVAPTPAPVAPAPPTPTPFGPMAPWSPMAPMQPMAPAAPLSWSDKLTG